MIGCHVACMKKIATISACLLIASTGIAFSNAVEERAPSARELLNEVRAKMPKEPFAIIGKMWKGKYPRRASRCIDVDAALHFGSDPVTARYSIVGGPGAKREQLTVTRKGRESVQFSYACGDPLVAAPMPDLSATIQDTEISWLDLTLSYLWWEDGSVVDADTVRGRDCYVVQLRVPPDEASYKGVVRLWIDCEYRLLLQAELYDNAGKPVRRLSVKSFKQINEQWMVKDIEVRNEVTRSFTTMRIYRVEGAGVNSDAPTPGDGEKADKRLILFPE